MAFMLMALHKKDEPTLDNFFGCFLAGILLGPTLSLLVTRTLKNGGRSSKLVFDKFSKTIAHQALPISARVRV